MLGEIDRENPYTRMIIEDKVKNWLRTIPAVVTSNGKHKKLFTQLSGLTQTSLEKNWKGKDEIKGTKDDGRLTSCNSFAGGYSIAILGSKLKYSLAAFDLKKLLENMGIPHAWKNQADDISARPGIGDLVRWRRLHVGVSLGFEGLKWNTIEGGKGRSRVLIRSFAGRTTNTPSARFWVGLISRRSMTTSRKQSRPRRFRVWTLSTIAASWRSCRRIVCVKPRSGRSWLVKGPGGIVAPPLWMAMAGRQFSSQ